MKRAIRLFYGFQFFFPLLLWLPIFYEYQRRSGLSDAQIFSIQSVYYVAFCLLEIPTGMLADIWGYRRCLLYGSLTLLLGNLLPILSPNYVGFLTHFLLIALSRSFISGASSAYLYELLLLHGAEEEYKQIEGNARAYGLAGKVLLWPLAGVLMEWHMGLPYWVTAAAALVSWGFALRLPPVGETPASREASLGGALLGPFVEWRSMLRALQDSPLLVALMLQGVAIFVLGRLCQVNLFQPILNSKSFALGLHGSVMSLMTIFEALGSARPGWLRAWLDDLNAVFALTIVMALALLLIPVAGQVATVLCLCLFAYSMGLAFPIQRQLLNGAIVDSRYRATFLSVESILDRAICAVAASFIGVFLQQGRLDAFLLLSCVLTFAAMAAIFVGMRLAAPRAASS